MRRHRGASAPGMARAVMLAAVVAMAPLAHAQSGDVAAQIKLIETQPAGMERGTWKDQRRDAARKLGQSRDRRAVPVLIRLAETETFDIIGEIAIEALGNIGDGAAAPALQKIAADPARDKAQRDAARKALAKLGPADAGAAAAGAGRTPAGGARTPAGGAAAGGTRTPAGGAAAGGAAAGGAAAGGAAAGAATDGAGATAGSPGGDDPAAGGSRAPESSAAIGDGLLGGRASESGLPPLPALDDAAIAAYERVTFAAGAASLGYDSARKRAAFDADLAGRYQKRIERDTMAWGWNAAAHVVAGYINPDGDALSRGAQVNIASDGEARFYAGPGSGLYGIGRAAIAAQINYVSDVDANNPDNTLKDTRFSGDVQIALGGGFGRVLDVGAAIRVRRLSRTLDAARALGKSIDAATARRLQLTWWALRGERSSYRALVSTVAILREAGILLGEPDAGLSYEILNVLRDSQLALRPSGFDVQLVFAEGYLQRPDEPVPNESGRVEQVLASAGYGAQLDDDKLELSGEAYGRLRLFAPEDQPSPWAIGATARMKRFAYGDHGDPVGAFDLAGDVRLSDDDLMDGQIGQRISAQLGFTWWLNQASGVRLAATVAEDRGTLFIGAELTATYGLLDGTFVGMAR